MKERIHELEQQLTAANVRIASLESENKGLWSSKTLLSAQRLERIKFLTSQINLWRGKFEVVRMENNALRRKIARVNKKMPLFEHHQACVTGLGE